MATLHTKGRVGVQHIDPAKSNATPSKDFSFKCHRDQQKSMIHSVNDIVSAKKKTCM